MEQRGASDAVYILEEPSLPYLKSVMAEGPLAFVKKVAEVDDDEVRESLVRFTGRPATQLPDDHFDKRGLASGAWGTLQARVAPLLTPGVLDLMSGLDFDPLQFYYEPTTLYLVFREGEAKATRAAFELVLLSLMGALCDWADGHRHAPKLPILMALDEAGAVRIPDLERLVSTSAGRHISLWLYMQSLGQLQTFYGRGGAQTILDGTYTKLFYPSQDLETWKHVSEMVGETSVEDKRTAKPQRWGATRTINEGKKSRRLITPDQVGRLKPDQLIAFVGNHPPMLGKRLDWRTDKKLRRLTLFPPPRIKRLEAWPESTVPNTSPPPDASTPTDYREPEV